MLRRTNYNEILESLSQVKDWLISNGVNTIGTRFDRYQELVEKIVQHQENNTLDRLIEIHGQELFYALTESIAFINIYKAFGELPEHKKIPTTKLRKIVEGPLLPQDEETENSSNEGRNLLFELEIAAQLKNHGIQIQKFDDIDCEIEGKYVNIQCKRLFSNNSDSISKNIQKAKEQIAKSLNARDIGRGIIALSIEKTLGTDGLILHVDKEAEIQLKASSKVNEFIVQNEAALQPPIDIRIIGVFLFFRFMTVIRNKNLLTRGNETEIKSFCFENSSDYLILKKIAEIFK